MHKHILNISLWAGAVVAPWAVTADSTFSGGACDYQLGCSEARDTCDFFADATFLYWYARETNLTTSVLFDMKPEIEGSANPETVQAFPNKYHHLDAKWDPGVRLGLGWNRGCQGWDLALYWTYFHNRSSDSHTVSYTGENPLNGEQGLLDLWQNHAFFATPIYEEVATKWSLFFNQIDLAMGGECCICPGLNLRPFVGLRTAWTRTDFDVKSRIGPKKLGRGILEQKNSDCFENTQWGVGFVVGAQPQWHLCGNVYLYGTGDIALLWGEFEGKKRTKYLGNGSRENQITFPFDVANVSRERYDTMNTLLGVGLGIRWVEGWCNDCYQTVLDLGWEHHIWFNHGFRHRPVDEVQITSGERYFTDTNDIVSDLVYGGLVLRLQFGF